MDIKKDSKSDGLIILKSNFQQFQFSCKNRVIAMKGETMFEFINLCYFFSRIPFY